MLVLVPAGLAWACVGVVSLTTGSSSVQPGGTLSVTGREFAAGSPVLIHLDSLTGPVLATVAKPGPGNMTSKFTVDVALPADIPSGQHILIATQDHHEMNSGQPARSVFYVGTAAPAPAPAAARPVGLVARSGRSGTSLVLIGLGVAVISLLLVGLWRVIAGRGRGQPPAEAPAGGSA
ncbi:MAG: hypothetical protein M3083_24850 [Actinomycetota bacterium]|nr:hypothetical protein [Actinomycetota bacterium]